MGNSWFIIGSSWSNNSNNRYHQKMNPYIKWTLIVLGIIILIVIIFLLIKALKPQPASGPPPGPAPQGGIGGLFQGLFGAFNL